MQEKNICPKCNREINQGHRSDRCDKEGAYLTRATDNKISIPAKYNKTQFEKFEVGNALILNPSGSLTTDAYKQNLKKIVEFVQIKLDSIENAEKQN